VKNTVLLIQPGHSTLKPRIPVNYLSIAAELMNNGFKVIIADLRVFDWDVAMKDVDWNDVVLVGLSCYTGPMILQCIDVAKKIRGIDSGIPIIWGGIHPTIEPISVAKHETVDIAVKGDGEETITEL
jgi:anaerobic magnesium-protoporphyrin IX monomethyl ester cyclase